MDDGCASRGCEGNFEVDCAIGFVITSSERTIAMLDFIQPISEFVLTLLQPETISRRILKFITFDLAFV